MTSVYRFWKGKTINPLHRVTKNSLRRGVPQGVFGQEAGSFEGGEACFDGVGDGIIDVGGVV